jgi:hypothetical protein
MARVVIDRSTRRLIYDPAVDGHESADEWASSYPDCEVWDTEKAGPCFLCGKPADGIGFVPDLSSELIPLCHPEVRRRETCLQRWRRGERPAVAAKKLPTGVLDYLDGLQAERLELDLTFDGAVVIRPARQAVTA